MLAVRSSWCSSCRALLQHGAATLIRWIGRCCIHLVHRFRIAGLSLVFGDLSSSPIACRQPARQRIVIGDNAEAHKEAGDNAGDGRKR